MANYDPEHGSQSSAYRPGDDDIRFDKGIHYDADTGRVFSKSEREEISQNHNEGKPRPTLILKDMPKAFNELLNVREYGAKKYSRMNWAASIGKPEAAEFLKDNLDSMYRHLNADQELDEESGCYHLAQVALRCMIAIEYMKGGES